MIIEGSGTAGNIVYLWITSPTGHTYYSVTINTDGKWSFTTPELADDTYKIEAAFKGADGVVTAKTGIYEVVVDTVAPGQPELGELSINALNLSDLLSEQSQSLLNDQPEEGAVIHDLKNSLLNDINFIVDANKVTTAGVLTTNDSTINSAYEMNEFIDHSSHN
jgi:hypothetical protein